jgi:hypothetical protein
VRQDHDLEDFLPQSDEEIATIASFLHGQEDVTNSALPDNDDEEEEEIGWGGTADEDSWGMASSSDAAKHHKFVQADRVAFELESGTRRPGDTG